MILIDEHTERELAAALEALRATPNTTRCIYFSLHDVPGLTEEILAATKRHIDAHDPHVYLCSDGDIFILADTIPSKDGRALMLDVAAYANRPVNETWVGFYEASLQLNTLLVVVEAKLDKRRRVEEEKKKLLVQQQADRKRQAILNSGTAITQEEIARRRAECSAPEIMIVEDDAFSRKLVENVLQKQYGLTCLGEATQALDTYARIAPDVLFLDINLPDVTGHELLERIIALDPQAYVIMLSGNADRENITQAMSKGAKGFVAKPFTKEKLFQYIDRCPSMGLKQRSHA